MGLSWGLPKEFLFMDHDCHEAVVEWAENWLNCLWTDGDGADTSVDVDGLTPDDMVTGKRDPELRRVFRLKQHTARRINPIMMTISFFIFRNDVVIILMTMFVTNC